MASFIAGFFTKVRGSCGTSRVRVPNAEADKGGPPSAPQVALATLEYEQKCEKYEKTPPPATY